MLKKRIVKGMLSLATAIMLVGSDPVIPMMESVGVVQEVKAASRKLSSTKVSVMTGEKHTITLKGVSSKKKKSVKWRSNSKNLVVSYSKKDTRNATFYARKAGTYKVIATYGKKNYVAVVKVSKKGMNAASRTLNKGQKYTLKLKGVKGKAKWSSSKKSVVTVKAAKNGKSAVITAKKPGSATITATVGKKKLVCVVKVNGTTAVVTPKPNPTTAPKPTESPKPQPTEAPKPTETPSPTPTEPVKPGEKPTPEPTPAEVKADKITLNRESVTFTALNQTFSLSATVTPENAEEKAVGWNSINTSAVTVDENGKITAVGRGSSEVFCFLKSNGEVFAKCSVTVQIPETKPEPTKPVEPKPTEPETVKVSGITLNPDISLEIKEGSSYTIKATVAPSNATNSSVKWSSSSTDVATVDDSGNVTAIKAGYTMITCTAVDGSGVSASCPVTVTAKSTTNPSEQDKTDPVYSFDMIYSDLDGGSTFSGGDMIEVNMNTNAPADKVSVVSSNSNVQYGALFVNGSNYDFAFYARKKGNSKVSILIDGKTVKSWDICVSSSDQNWLAYDAWWNEMISNMGSNWTDANNLQKVINVGQYLLDNYDYNGLSEASFHKDGGGSCNASSSVLVDTARKLGLYAEVVTPKSYVINNPNHVVAKVWYEGCAYLIEAGYQGKAGNRGVVACVRASEQ